MNESEVPIEFQFEDGQVLRAVLDVVRAPQIVDAIRHRLPLESRTVLVRNEMKIPLDISRGNQKPTHEVKAGDIAYMPLGDSLCIYLADMRTFSPVNVIGRVRSIDNLDMLRHLRRGARVTVRLSE